MADIVALESRGHFALCTLNLPEKRNPISPAMRAALRTSMEQLLADEQIRSVIITGAGSAFCSGMDLQALSEQSSLSPEHHAADSQSIADFFEFIRTYPKPTIAAVNGPAVAGGCGLALLCDFALASEEAFFSFSEVKIGFVPALVGVYLERMIGAKAARDLLLTGRRVSAEEALRLGLITAVAPASMLLEQTAELAGVLAQNGPAALRATRELLTRASSLPLQNALKLAIEVNAAARITPECREGVAAFLAKRAPSWCIPGAQPSGKASAERKRQAKGKSKG
jgi:methylglutaconyl-CoA hydratase